MSRHRGREEIYTIDTTDYPNAINKYHIEGNTGLNMREHTWLYKVRTVIKIEQRKYRDRCQKGVIHTKSYHSGASRIQGSDGEGQRGALVRKEQAPGASKAWQGAMIWAVVASHDDVGRGLRPTGTLQ